MEANIVLSKCNVHNRTFGIRVEKRGNDWHRTWAFKINDEKAKREGYDKTSITGSFPAIPEYPGCPYCGEKHNFIRCSCGKMSCWKPGQKKGACHWCGTIIENTVTRESFDFSGSRF